MRCLFIPLTQSNFHIVCLLRVGWIGKFFAYNKRQHTLKVNDYCLTLHLTKKYENILNMNKCGIFFKGLLLYESIYIFVVCCCCCVCWVLITMPMGVVRPIFHECNYCIVNIQWFGINICFRSCFTDNLLRF